MSNPTIDIKFHRATDVKGQVVLVIALAVVSLLFYTLQYFKYRLKNGPSTCRHCGLKRQTWMVTCNCISCRKVYCWDCSYLTMLTANDHFDFEDADRVSVCLSHLRRGQIQLNTIIGAEYSKDSFPPMPRPKLYLNSNHAKRRSPRLASHAQAK